MERKKNFAGILVVCFLQLLIYTHTEAQKINLNQKLYRAFVSDSMMIWNEEIKLNESTQNPTNSEQLQLLNYYYGYAAWLISISKDDEAEMYIEKAERIIKSLLAGNYEVATLYAYQGAFYGFKIGLAPYKALSLGPKSNEAISKSIKMDSKNIQGQIEKGNAAYYTPSIFGGSKKVALEAYKKAIHLMEEQDKTIENWQYINALSMLAQCYERTGYIERAEHTYEKILDLEPDFVWVRDELYPNFVRRTKL